MFATTSEIEQYIRMTLKQWSMSHLKIQWMNSERHLGLAYVAEGKIKLSKRILCSFKTFDEVLKHEIAHHIQWKRNGNRFLLTKNGRRSFHGKDFAAVCKEMGIPARTHIPLPTVRYIDA
jgi:predicted SprT family Zn-dependent metalloprotease